MEKVYFFHDYITPDHFREFNTGQAIADVNLK